MSRCTPTRRERCQGEAHWSPRGRCRGRMSWRPRRARRRRRRARASARPPASGSAAPAARSRCPAAAPACAAPPPGSARDCRRAQGMQRGARGARAVTQGALWASSGAHRGGRRGCRHRAATPPAPRLWPRVSVPHGVPARQRSRARAAARPCEGRAAPTEPTEHRARAYTSRCAATTLPSDKQPRAVDRVQASAHQQRLAIARPVHARGLERAPLLLQCARAPPVRAPPPVWPCKRACAALDGLAETPRALASAMQRHLRRRTADILHLPGA